MKRIKDADINFKVNPKRINLKNFSMRFYTVNSQLYFFIKDQDDLVSVEREATIYDDPEVIISGGTVAVDYYLPLDWSELVQLGEGVLNYRCINNIEDPFFPDFTYNQVVEDTTGYYIDSDIHVDPAQDKDIIKRLAEVEARVGVEQLEREEADTAISGAVDSEIARAISAETELSDRINELESGTSEALDAEIERAISAETALQDAIDAEEERAIAQENAIRQDLTDETELRTSADTVILATVNDEIVRATSADTALDNKIDVETLRAIGVENAISGNLETYKATNNAALQAETTRATSAETKIATDLSNYITSNNHALADEVSRATSAETALNNALTAETASRESEVTRATAAENAISGVVDNYITTNNAAVQGEITRATSAETALQNAIGDETTARANADAALSTRIDNLSSASTAAIEAEEARAREAESGLTTALNNEVSRATSAETIIANSLNGEITRATSAETALNNQIDAEVLRATAAEADLEAKIGVVSGATELINAETARAVTVENALSGAIDSISAATSGDVEALDAKINTVSGNVITETTRATNAENALGGRIDAEEARAKGVEDVLSGAIDTLDVRFFDDAKYEDSGNTKVINFYNGNVVKATIDATDFIKDGMISTVELIPSGSTSVLVITWNTDGGSKVTTIDIGDIFEADNYYQKSETSGATEIANAIDAVSGAIPTQYVSNIGKNSDNGHTRWFDVYKNGVNSLQIYNFSINGRMPLTKQNGTDANIDNFNLVETSDFTTHTNDSTIHLTSGDIQSLIDSSISGKANSSDVYLKTETSGATELATAFAAKQDTLIAGENITISGNVISAGGGGGGITSGEVQTMITSATTPIYQTIEDNEEVTAEALNVLNASVSGKADSSDVYLKSETSGATELATALATKQNQLTAGSGIDITSNVISVTGGTGGGISSAECQTMIDQSISEKTNQSDFTGHTADTTIHVTAQDKTNWNNKSNFSGDYNDLTNKPTIPTVPTNVSDFTNDAGYITSNDISGKTNQSDFTAHTANTSIHVTTAQTAAWDAKSDFSGSYNDLTDKPTIPTVPTSNTAFTNDAGYITANDITGKTDVTAFTAHTGDTTIHVTSSDKTSWNGAVTNASNAVTALGGLSLVKLTQAQYDALATKDNNTLYVIVG